MRPLYCYKYDEETCSVTEICITNYVTKTNSMTGRSVYSWDCPKINPSYSHESVPDTKLDRFVNGKVYTFEHGIDYVKSIIHEDITRRYNEAESARLRWNYARMMFEKRNPEFKPNPQS